jgi:plasmid stability protein
LKFKNIEMASAKFFLKNPKSETSTLIYLVFQFNYYEIINGKKKFKFLKYSTGEKIEPKFWNPRSNQARKSDKFPGYNELNTRLKILAAIVEDEYRKILNDGLKPSPELLRDNLNVRLGKSVPAANKPITLFEFIAQFIEDSKSGQRTTDNGKRFSAMTVKSYNNTFNVLKRFQKKYKRTIDFDTIDLDFYDDLIAYLNKENYATNTIGKLVKNVKVFMRVAGDKKLHENFEFQNKRFKKITENTDSIYLRDAEIEQMFRLDLSEYPDLEKIRDLFVIGCYTGLRFSDYNKIVPQNIRHNEKGTFLYAKPQKTNERVVIPLHWIVMAVLERNDDRIPKLVSNTEMNRGLKQIGKLAGIDELVSIVITRGGLRMDLTYKKYELIGSHTARRSFATNMYLADIPPISIMKITGHKTEMAFMRYIKISQEDNANKLIDHPYFSQGKPGNLKIVK